MDEPSKLDLRIARDKLLADHPESIWEDLCAAIGSVSAKLNKAYSHALVVQRNEHNSIIQVSYSTTSTGDTENNRQIHIRFDRDNRKVIVTVLESISRIGAHKLPPTRSDPIIFEIAADADGKELCFVSAARERFSPATLAEHLLAEKLVGMNLSDECS